MNWFDYADDRWVRSVRIMREIRKHVLRNSGALSYRDILVLRLSSLKAS